MLFGREAHTTPPVVRAGCKTLDPQRRSEEHWLRTASSHSCMLLCQRKEREKVVVSYFLEQSMASYYSSFFSSNIAITVKVCKAKPRGISSNEHATNPQKRQIETFIMHVSAGLSIPSKPCTNGKRTAHQKLTIPFRGKHVIETPCGQCKIERDS